MCRESDLPVQLLHSHDIFWTFIPYFAGPVDRNTITNWIFIGDIVLPQCHFTLIPRALPPTTGLAEGCEGRAGNHSCIQIPSYQNSSSPQSQCKACSQTAREPKEERVQLLQHSLIDSYYSYYIARPFRFIPIWKYECKNGDICVRGSNCLPGTGVCLQRMCRDFLGPSLSHNPGQWFCGPTKTIKTTGT